MTTTKDHQRLLQASNANWLLGWWKNRVGAAFYGQWIRKPVETALGGEWIVFAARNQVGHIGLFQDAVPNQDTVIPSSFNFIQNLTLAINVGPYPDETSRADISDLEVYNHHLNDDQIIRRSQELMHFI